MVTRIILLFLVAVLALPIAAVTPPTEARRDAWGEISVEAKKSKKGKAKFKTVTRTVRQPLTRTFANPASITMPASGTGADTGSPSAPYPSVINVSGFVNGRILDINLTLNGYNQTEGDNADVLLQPAHLPSRNAIVMSDAGGNADPSNVTLTLDDQAVAALPVELEPLVSGTFRPTNHDVDTDFFPLGAPVPSGNSALSIFNANDPNGTWQLFVVDDEDQDIGNFAGGWSLQITADADVQVQERVKIKKGKKKGRR